MKKNKNLCGNVRTAYMPADTVAVYHHYISYPQLLSSFSC